MSEDTNAAVTEAQTVEITLAGQTFTLVETRETPKKTKNNPNPTTVEYLAPRFESNADVGTFITALLDEAEAAKAGSAEQLADKFLKRHFKDAVELYYDKDGNVRTDLIPSALIATRHTSTISESALKELNDQLNAEMASVFPIMSAELTDKELFHKLLADAGFTEDMLLTKILQIQQRQQDVQEKMQEAVAAKALRASKKAQKEAAAAAAAVA